MQEMGLHAYRFSIAWPRILPQGRGGVNQAGLDFYSRLVDGLLEAGITPFATLFHWDLPQALQDEGGFAARSTAEAFVEYTDVITRHLGDRVQHWITHNEPAVFSLLGHWWGMHAPGEKDLGLAMRVSHHLLLSHGWAVPVIRANSPSAEVGITLSVNWLAPASNSAADRDAHRRGDGIFTRWFIDPLYGRGYPGDLIADAVEQGALPPAGADFVQAGDLAAIAVPTDFLGINYYTRHIVRDGEAAENLPPTLEAAGPGADNWSSLGWENYPDGLLYVLNRIYFDYLPPKIYITESGVAYETGPDEAGHVPDWLRLYYFQRHFAAAQRAIQGGVPLAGYFVWSFLDNFEWAEGYAKRFGMVWVDYESQARIIKESGRWYSQVIARNRVEVV
jgi:beta-glucosidase